MKATPSTMATDVSRTRHFLAAIALRVTFHTSGSPSGESVTGRRARHAIRLAPRRATGRVLRPCSRRRSGRMMTGTSHSTSTLGDLRVHVTGSDSATGATDRSSQGPARFDRADRRRRADLPGQRGGARRRWRTGLGLQHPARQPGLLHHLHRAVRDHRARPSPRSGSISEPIPAASAPHRTWAGGSPCACASSRRPAVPSSSASPASRTWIGCWPAWPTPSCSTFASLPSRRPTTTSTVRITPPHRGRAGSGSPRPRAWAPRACSGSCGRGVGRWWS